MFALQSVMMFVIFDPVTPGAFSSSIDWSIPSSSATHDDMFEILVKIPTYLSLLQITLSLMEIYGKRKL